MAWSSGTLYSTSVDGNRMVLSRPPSLEPSTPEVSEPTKYGRFEIKSGPIGYLPPRSYAASLWSSPHRCNDDGRGPVVAQPARINHQVVMRGIQPVMVVDLADVGSPVGVDTLDPLPRRLFTETEPLTQRSYPIALRSPEEDVQST